jgi:hypothetical protein
MSTARELRAVWAIVAAMALAVLVTYARLPADELTTSATAAYAAG